MLPDARFTKQPKAFWANIRSISQTMDYVTAQQMVRTYSLTDMQAAMGRLGLSRSHIVD